AGWFKDAKITDRIYTLELIYDSKVIACTQTDLAHELGGRGRFVIRIPDDFMDESVYRFSFRIKELNWDFETRSFLMPLLKRIHQEQKYPFLDDSIWENTPAEIQARKIRLKSERAVKGYEQEIKDLEKQLSEITSNDDEKQYELICKIGDLFGKNLQLEAAEAQFKKAIVLDNKSPQAYSFYSDLLCSCNDETAAIKLITKALKKIPGDSSLLERLDCLTAPRHKKHTRFIAFYLPQFHPISENDQWWGKGFTEWNNVTTATELFEGHLQPRRPTSLGYYDLRVPESVNAQFELAKQYGIDAFCYYYYWFDGKRVLERPLQDLVEGNTGPFPFCICWANEDWTRSWDGLSGEVLLAQKHSIESDFRFIQDIEPLLRHPDYIRQNDKLVLLIYRADKLATPKKTVKAWRKWCRKEGIGELHLCAVQSFGFDDPRPYGFDAAVEFPPHSVHEKYPDTKYYQELNEIQFTVEQFKGSVFDYQTYADAFINRPREPYSLHRGCFLAWDNTARRKKSADIFHNFSVNQYRNWLSQSTAKSAVENKQGLVFINAWNEWAEGAVLEPDSFFGYELLEATQQAKVLAPYLMQNTYWKQGMPNFIFNRIIDQQRIVIVGHDAHRNGAQINMLNMVRCLKQEFQIDVLILLLKGGELVTEYEHVGTTLVLDNAENWKQSLKDIAIYYKSLGTKKVISNTVVTGEVVQILKTLDYHVVSLIHELPSLIEAQNLQKDCWSIARNADSIVFASNIVANEFVNRYYPEPKKILIAPQGIVFNPHSEQRQKIRSKIREKLDFSENTLLIMGCGFGDKRKGIDLFVLMAGIVSRLLAHTDIAFIWVGAVEDNLSSYIQADIKQLGLDNSFHITGFVQDTSRYYVAADVFALTSREDPFPSVVMEAFDAGLPVVAFDGGGGYVDIVNDKTGALVPYIDVSAMSEAIVSLVEGTSRRNRISQYVYQYCRDNFGYPDYLKKLLALLAGVPPKAVMKGISKPQPWYENFAIPTITVIVPNFNYGRYLELRLRTIVDQTLSPTEIIVLDDASTDYSLEVIQLFSDTSAIPIKLIKSKSNSGNPFVQWAKGIKQAKGELIWIAEADDYCEPNLLAKLAEEFIDKNVVLAWADSCIVNEKGHGDGFEYKTYYVKEQGMFWHHSFKMEGKELIEKCLVSTNVIPNASAVVFRRNAVEKDLTMIQQYGFSGDWWFWISLAEKGKVSYLSEILNYHRRHSQSVMGNVLQKGEKLILETMAFYLRLAQHKPNIFSSKTRIDVFQKLEKMYQLFPNLTEEHPQLRSNPSFQAQYQQLIKQLEPVKALEKLQQKTPATLILSQDVFSDSNNTSRLIHCFLKKYDLQIIFLADDDAVKLFMLDAEIDVNNNRIISIHSMEGNKNNNQVLTGILKKEGHFISFGLSAHIVIERQWIEPNRNKWTMIVSNEFNILLGKLPEDSKINLKDLKNAVKHHTDSYSISDEIPYAFQIMARFYSQIIERLDLSKVNYPQKNHTKKSDSTVKVVVSLSEEKWLEEISLLKQKRKQEQINYQLKFLVMGNEMEWMEPIVKDNSFVELIWIYEKPIEKQLQELFIDYIN
ncbi:MAG: glycoside hydrolase family 99-like domain-containing protein, partial [Methylococcaceae bacterium]